MVSSLSLKSKAYVIDENALIEEPIKWCTVSLTEVSARGKRLEATVYDVEIKQARKQIMGSKHPLMKICGETGIATAYTCERFKRVWVEKSDYPIFQPSAILDMKPVPDGYISHLTKIDINSLRVKKGQILLTCSGTIGNVSLVSETFDNAIFSHDLLRITCNNPEDTGYLYTYLKSSIGNKILQSNNYGAVITHIEAEHLKDVPIPNPPAEIKKEINELIMNSFSLRDKANKMIDEATRRLIDELELPPIEDLKPIKRFGIQELNSFSIKLSDLNGRLDASYHIPITELIIQHLSKVAAEVTFLGDRRISKQIILAGVFKRIYVDEEYGYPFIGGKEITQLTPKTEKFLSRALYKKRYEKELKVSENTILVTDRGTIGTVALVPKHWNGLAVSQNVLKIIPSGDEIAGYLYVFLSSELGQILIRRQTYGSVVNMIDDHSLENVEIPFLKDQLVQKTINDLALEANKIRYQAYLLEQEAIKIMNKEVLGL